MGDLRTQGRVVVVGGGVGGLCASIALASRGVSVTVLERQPQCGGKVRQHQVADTAIDAGPTVFTMCWVFDQLFDAAGASFENAVGLTRAATLARHSWHDGSTLDLHASAAESNEAIAQLAGKAEARRFVEFCDRSRDVYRSLESTFLTAQRPNPIELAQRFGLRGLPALLRISPFSPLWGELGRTFSDSRLRQLFGRYATYCGTSPFSAPATLMLVAHVERDGVYFINGGMFALVKALCNLAERLGVTIRTGCNVHSIALEHGRVNGVLCEDERIAADAVIFNGDPAALAIGLAGTEVKEAAAPMAESERSLSAITWSMHAPVSGFDLHHHTVLFSPDYRAEFDALCGRRRLPDAQTIYLCAQDRDDAPSKRSAGSPERLLCLINAPAIGDRHQFSAEEIDSCEMRVFKTLQHHGVEIDRSRAKMQLTTPNDFHALYPATGGALYGRASNGWRSTFQRPGSRTPIAGLYLAGGATHPGPGVPMAALSGRLAAAAVLHDLALTRLWHPMATPGGTSTPSATTGNTR